MAPSREILSMNFVVRHLECKSLDGAFRVHISPEGLDQLDLQLGDVCQISSEDGDSKGYGIAWRATDRMGNAPKVKPIKITDYLKNVLDIKDGSHVTVSKVDAKVVRAGKIVLCDVSPNEYGPSTSDTTWKSRTKYLLCTCEAISSGVTFEVSGRNKLKRRFCVEQISSDDVQTGVLGLYVCDDDTELDISDGKSITSLSMQKTGPNLSISADYVGGLADQIKTLNQHMRDVLRQTQQRRNRPITGQDSINVLVHGYEGTGKSLLLNKLGESGFRKVLRLKRTMLTGGTVSKNQLQISDLFSEARVSQPSLLLMDDIQNLASKNDSNYADTIADEIAKLEGTGVFIVASCRSPADLNSTLIGPDCFAFLVELPIPDLEARTAILDVLLSETNKPNDRTSKWLSPKTHGYTGKDLKWLRKIATSTARARLAEAANPDQNSLVATLPQDISLDGSAYSQAATIIEQEQQKNKDEESQEPLVITAADWELALKTIRPTALREIFFEKPNVQWSDIGGSNSTKDLFDRIIGWPLRYPGIMKRLQISAEKGVLLYGPPGCSKTITAQAVATSYDLNFIAVKGAELINMYVGESERAVREIFRKARAAAPCIIFFDEIDAIASERDSAGTKGLHVVTTLLNEMDGFDALTNVLVLAATNKPEALDPAIMRPGRFGTHVYLGLPDEHARAEIFAISTRDLPLLEDVHFDALVRNTQGYTGAEIVQICNFAKEETWRRTLAAGGELPMVSHADFVGAIQGSKRGVTEEMLASYTAFAKRSDA